MNFPFFHQLNSKDCGPTCVRMIAKWYGKHYKTETLRQYSGFNKQGTNIFGLSVAAEKLGFRTRGVLATYEQLANLPLPCILHWNRNHFVVLVELSKNKSSAIIADPARGIYKVKKDEFIQNWIAEEEEGGFLLTLEPTAAFYSADDEKQETINLWHAVKYFKGHALKLFQIFLSVTLVAILQLTIPILSRFIVDIGVKDNNIDFVALILISQFILVLSKNCIEFIRSRILLRLSNILNFSLLSDFWIKLTRLPLAYFDTHQTGDTLQRINDHKEIQDFLTGPSINTLFSIITLFALSTLLFAYHPALYIIFFVGSIAYLGWTLLFLKARRRLNYKGFHVYAQENNATLEFVQGMQEIRLNNSHHLKRWNWENLQTKIFKLEHRIMSFSQWQTIGATTFSQARDLIIMFISVKLVIDGSLTLGTLIAIQYVIGQLGNPIDQIVNFIQNAQDAQVSLERLNDVQHLQNEENSSFKYSPPPEENKTIKFTDVSFSYPGAGNKYAIEDINMEIEEGRVTALVGTSGSGKTTILKLLLKFYDDYSGTISIGTFNFKYINPTEWRDKCGSVLQNGFLFNDSIAQNIALGYEQIDYDKLIFASKIANIYDMINTLPNGFFTQLGAEGNGLSEGQKQRILIARSVYKNPDYLFFDEATNSLDANNELEISQNLQKIFKGRTVVIIAHRLSTVKNADKIVVLSNGKIVEQGTHNELLAAGGQYHKLVRNQLSGDQDLLYENL